ncbi:MAG: M48 family metalloprotease [Kamptonema sp. SIO4C4]|nr:M48 family metalloprotease [Kamptonema sp. SIO4C4]
MNQIKTVALLAVLSGLLITISYTVLGGWGGAMLGIVLAALTNLVSWYYSDKIALAAYGAQPITSQDAPQLYRLVQQLSDRAGLPMPQVYIVPTDAANAFATGRDPQHAAVAVTRGLLHLLPLEELEGVLAHELSHVANRDTLTQAVAATIAGAIAFLAQMLSYTLFFFGGRNNEEGGNPLGLLFTIILAPIIATILQLSISRTREFAADAKAAQLTGNPKALANALQRLDYQAKQQVMPGNPAFEPLLITNNSRKALFANLFSTHPSTQARIEKLLERETFDPPAYVAW